MEDKYLLALNKILKLASENKEFGDALRERLCGTKTTQTQTTVPSTQETTKIDLIYEYCIKQIMSEQAKLFYAPFVDYDIHDTLVADYIRMEDFRRKNNFWDYSLALYQQIEAITNKFFYDARLQIIYKSILPIMANSKDSIGNAILGTGDFLTGGITRLHNNQSWAKEKIKFVVYVLGFLGNKWFDKNAFIKLTNTLNDIYLCRNINHRGIEQDDKNADKLEHIKANTSWSYFEFNNALVEYVRIMNLDDKRKNQIFDYLPCSAVITTKMPSAVFIKTTKVDCAIQVPDQFFNKVSNKVEGDTIEVVCINNNILNVLD